MHKHWFIGMALLSDNKNVKNLHAWFENSVLWFVYFRAKLDNSYNGFLDALSAATTEFL